MKKHHFNFNELLLVSGVAAVIVALATAAAGNMSSDAKIAACTEVIRKIDQKLNKFEADNDGWIISGNNQNKLWGRQLVMGGYFDEDGFHRNNKKYPKNFECPAETRIRMHGKSKLPHPSVNIANAYDYALNWGVHVKVHNPQGKTFKRADLKNPAQLMSLVEATKFAVTHQPTDVTDRHGDSAGNVLFFDGHIEFMQSIPYRDADNYTRKFWFN